MRLSEKEQAIIKKTFLEVYGQGQISLFGSRVEDDRLGGDIDLYLKVLPSLRTVEMARKFRIQLYMQLGEQKIDIVYNKDPERLVEKEAEKNGLVF